MTYQHINIIIFQATDLEEWFLLKVKLNHKMEYITQIYGNDTTLSLHKD